MSTEKKKKNGFTIVESLVAITILVLVVVGTSSAIQTSISSYIFSKDQIIAFYLAQEGFEQIRNIRDGNRLKNPPDPWLTGISVPCPFGEYCSADAVTAEVNNCGTQPGSCPMLQQDTETKFFGHDHLGWPDSIFRREIMLTQISAKEISIEVTIYWSKGIVNRQFKAKENLLNY